MSSLCNLSLAYLLLLFTPIVNCKFLTCVCTTTHCQAQGQATCNTTSMCYSQYLDRRDGSNPLVRGCITSKTPLLCENRRPAVRDRNWPILACCNSNLCNQDVVPTVPPWMTASTRISASTLSSDTSDTRYNRKESTYSFDSASKADTKGSFGNSNDMDGNNLVPSGTTTTSGASSPRIGPIYITVLVVGVMSLVIIGVIALFILRRNDRFYEASDYIAHHFKGHHITSHHNHHHHHPHIREDPELQLPLPRATNEIYENKLIVNT